MKKSNGYTIVIGKSKGNGFFNYVVGNKNKAKKIAKKLKDNYKTLTIWGLEGKPKLITTLIPTKIKPCSMCGELTDGDYSNYCLKCEEHLFTDNF